MRRFEVLGLILLATNVWGEDGIYSDNGCDWRVKKGYHATGSTQSGPDMALVDCLDMCRRLEGCVAADYVEASKACWWHTDPKNLDDVSLYSGTNLYIREVTCDSEPAAETYSDNSCSWELHRNSHRGETNWAERGLGLADCLGFCRRLGDCKAVDFVPSSGDCWLHVNTTAIQEEDIKVQTGTHLYIMDNNQCETLEVKSYLFKDCRWTLRKYTHAYGSEDSRPDVPLFGCLEQCRFTDKCVGVDYVKNSRTCWWHMDAANLDDTRLMAFTDLYVKNRDDCDQTIEREEYELNGCTWEFTREMHAFGASASHSGVGLDDCLEYCRILGTGCAGLDYIESTEECWIHSSQDDLDDVEAEPGSDLYRKGDGECNTFEREEMNYKGCDWSVLHYNHALGSTSSHSEVDLYDCLDICRSSDTCLGLDFLKNTSTCWLHEDQDNLDQAEPAIESSLYVLSSKEDCDPVEDEHYEHKTCSWRVRRNFHLQDAAASPQSNLALEECLDFCRNTAGCVALDYVVSARQCWWHHSPQVLDNEELQVGTDLYLRPQGCGMDLTVKYTLDGCVWLVRENVHAVGSTTNLNEVDQDECLRACVADAACRGADYVRARDTCWLHLHSDNLETIEVQTGTQLFTKDSGDCDPESATNASQTTTTTEATSNPSPKPSVTDGVAVNAVMSSLLLLVSILCSTLLS